MACKIYGGGSREYPGGGYGNIPGGEYGNVKVVSNSMVVVPGDGSGGGYLLKQSQDFDGGIMDASVYSSSSSSELYRSFAFTHLCSFRYFVSKSFESPIRFKSVFKMVSWSITRLV